MSKICGYSCEHNKSGVCQISVCDKRTIMSDKTEAQIFTRYIDPTITKLQQENLLLKENAEHYDEEGNLVPEHKPYYSSVIFLGEQINSLEECKELYVEEEIEKE